MLRRARWTGLGRVLWQQPYEAAVAVASMSGVLELSRTRGSASAAELYPHWILYAIGVLLAVGGALTAAGLLGAGYAASDVGRVMARRFEQAGQYLLSGALLALGASASSQGERGVIAASVDIALAAAAAARAVMVSRAIARAGRDEAGP